MSEELFVQLTALAHCTIVTIVAVACSGLTNTCLAEASSHLNLCSLVAPSPPDHPATHDKSRA